MGICGGIGKYIWPYLIKVAVMAVKEEDLWIKLASSTGPTEETHFLHSSIPVHIS